MTAPGPLRYRSLIWNFAQRDLKSRFKGTAIGWGWSLILPLATLAIYTIISHYIFRADPPDFGDGRKGNFAVWLFVGLTAWMFFANTINTAIPALLSTGPLLKKIYFPSYTPVLGAVIGVAIQSGIELGVVLVVLGIFGSIGWTWVLLPLWAAMFVAFAASLGVVFAIANIYFRDLAHIISVVLQLMFYATPILYQDTLIKNVTGHRLLMSNPLSQFVDIFRDLGYGLTPSTLFSWGYALAWTLACVGLAVWVFNRFGRDLGEEV